MSQQCPPHGCDDARGTAFDCHAAIIRQRPNPDGAIIAAQVKLLTIRPESDSLCSDWSSRDDRNQCTESVSDKRSSWSRPCLMGGYQARIRRESDDGRRRQLTHHCQSFVLHRRVPLPSCTVVANSCPSGLQATAPTPGARSRKLGHLCPRREFPDKDVSTTIVTRGYETSVGREGNGRHKRCRPTVNEEIAPGGRVPNLHRLIATRPRQKTPVPRERQVISQLLCQAMLRNSWPLAGSRSLITPSSAAEARMRPSGENVTR